MREIRFHGDLRHCQLQRGERFHVALDDARLFVPHQPQIIISLQARPHFRARAEEPRQPRVANVAGAIGERLQDGNERRETERQRNEDEVIERDDAEL